MLSCQSIAGAIFENRIMQTMPSNAPLSLSGGFLPIVLLVEHTNGVCDPLLVLVSLNEFQAASHLHDVKIRRPTPSGAAQL